VTDSTIQVRVDGKTKASAKKVLNDIGIDMSSAIKVYLKQIVITKSIPFRLLTENQLSIEQEEEILNAAREGKKGVNTDGPFDSKQEIKTYLDSIK